MMTTAPIPISQGAMAALRRLASIDHRAELIFRGYADHPPINREEAIELLKAGLAEKIGGTIRITIEGARRVVQP